MQVWGAVGKGEGEGRKGKGRQVVGRGAVG